MPGRNRFRWRISGCSSSARCLSDVVPSIGPQPFSSASTDLKFASAVAGFGMILRDSPHKGAMTINQVQEIASQNTKSDEYRVEFVELVKKARSLHK